ncbi:PepSY domain-containing protein, partial [Bacillus sp. EB600]|uniref:PepSY domain-containing protein n=1 Tax=Bacillus sp. EB600 TaxID=2806345 RepID=UPI00210DEE1E
LKKSNEHDDNKMLKRVSPQISLESAKKTALNTTQGTITKVELDNEDNQPVYEIKIKTMDHREVEVKVDAANGKVLGKEYNDD